MTKTVHGRRHGRRQDPSRSRWTDPPAHGPVVFDPTLRTAAALAARDGVDGLPLVVEQPASPPAAQQPEPTRLSGGHAP